MESLALRRCSHATAGFSCQASIVLAQPPKSARTAFPAALGIRKRKVGATLYATASAPPAMLSPDKKEEYNKSMSKQMGWKSVNPYEYHPERGLYYHEVAPNLICGSQPQTPEDIEILHNVERVTNIVNLQEDKDFAYWGVDFEAYSSRAKQLGMYLDRRPIVDFDGESLRRTLPRIVLTLEGALSAGGRVYIHCTAGLGRAPAACIAWLYWFGGRQLDEAYTELTSIRPCGPKRDAIRAATFDLLDSRGWQEFQHLPSDAYAFLNDDDRSRLQQRLRERY